MSARSAPTVAPQVPPPSWPSPTSSRSPRPATSRWCRGRATSAGALSGLKTTSYGDNAKALAYAHDRGGAEAIFGNLAGNLCEGTGSNVFLVRDGQLITPPLSSGCLAGITRALVLEWSGGEEVDTPLGAFTEADEAFLTSTTRDVQPIRAVDGVVFPAAPGPVTRKAIEVFNDRGAADLDP